MPQQPARDGAVALDEPEVVLVAELDGVGRFVADLPQPRDAPAFLIDGDDRLDGAQVAQVVDELPQLRGRLDVSPEEDEPARLDAPEGGGGVGVEREAGDAGEEELAEGHGARM